MARRKSTAGNSVETGGSLDVSNTGLRPSWTEFWEVESGRTLSGNSPRDQRSTQSTTRTDTVFRQMRFISGSEWQGEWDRLGLNGFGTYRMPHGVVYEGMMNGGAFEGIGILRYPNGGAVEGLWHEGRLKYSQYEYADGLRRDQAHAWPYCKTPDRRFYSEIVSGLKAADGEQLADAEPPVDLPPGTYDVGDGVYSPKTKCVTDPVSGAILRIPTVAEERWIVDNCRSASENTVGFSPELYDNWWEDVSAEAQYGDDERAILQLIRQPGCDLDPVEPDYSRRRHSTVDVSNLASEHSMSTGRSHSNYEFEEFVRRVVKEAEEARRKSILKKPFFQQSPPKTPESVEPGEWFDESEDEYMRTSSLVKVIKEISQKYLAKGKTYDSKMNTVTSTTTMEMLKMRTLDIPSQTSHSSTDTKPFHVADHTFSQTLSTAPAFPTRQNDSDRSHPHRSDSESGTSDMMQSKLKYEIDYSEFEIDESVGPSDGLCVSKDEESCRIPLQFKITSLFSCLKTREC